MIKDKILEFYNNKNKTERYLWPVVSNVFYKSSVFKLLKKYDNKKIYIGEYIDDSTNKKINCFYVLIDKLLIEDIESLEINMNLLKIYLKDYNNIKIINHNNYFLIVIDICLTDTQMNYFFDSKYSKIFYLKDKNSYPFLFNDNVLNAFKIPEEDFTNGKVLERHKKLVFKKEWYILQKSKKYYYSVIKPTLDFLSDSAKESIKNNEYDSKINLSEEYIDLEKINYFYNSLNK